MVTAMETQNDPLAPMPDRLRQYRELRGLSHRELGAAAGVCHRTIGYIEARQTTPSLRVLTLCAGALGIEVRDLFGRRPPRRKA